MAHRSHFGPPRGSRDYGRVEGYGGARYDPRRVPTAGTAGAVKWRVIAYKTTGGEVKLSEHATRDDAVDALQAHIAAVRKGS